MSPVSYLLPRLEGRNLNVWLRLLEGQAVLQLWIFFFALELRSFPVVDTPRSLFLNLRLWILALDLYIKILWDTQTKFLILYIGIFREPIMCPEVSGYERFENVRGRAPFHRV